MRLRRFALGIGTVLALTLVVTVPAWATFTGSLRVTKSSIKPRSFHLSGGKSKYCFTLNATATGYVRLINSKSVVVQRFTGFTNKKTACRTWKGRNKSGRNVTPGNFVFQVKARNATSHGFGGNRTVIVMAPKPASTGGGGGGGPNCTPGYSPCLIDHGGADYDCAGGTGNGPYYTEPGVTYRVTGSDPYGLDGNNNGLGCE
jgi:hypothetical protein